MVRLLGLLVCALGIHSIDLDGLWRRKRQAAAIGVDVSRGMPCLCRRCGRGFWR